MNPEISIIVTCYNYAQYVAECLTSIKNQDFVNWECLIIDDGSTDDTKLACSHFLSDARFSYHFQTNAGVSAARNNGLYKANGEYVICIDADDYVSPDFLKHLLACFKNDKSLSLAYPNVVFFGARTGKWILPDFSYGKLLKNNMIVVSALYRKSDFLLSGGYDVDMRKGSEDWEYWIRFLQGNKTVVKSAEAIIYYRIKPMSKNAIALADKNILNDTYRYITKKHSSVYKDLFESPLVLYHQLHEKEFEYFHKPFKVWFDKLTGKRKSI